MTTDLLDEDELWHPTGLERCGMCDRQMPQPYAYEGYSSDNGRMTLGEPLCERCTRAVLDDEDVKIYRAPRRAVRSAREVDGDVPVTPAARPPEPPAPSALSEPPAESPAVPLAGTVVTAAERASAPADQQSRPRSQPAVDHGLPRPGLLSISRWVRTGW